MDRDERGRFVSGTAPGPGRPVGVVEVQPRERPRTVRVVSGEYLQPLTLNRLDRRTRAGREIDERISDLMEELDRLPDAYRYFVCQQIAYLEFRLSMMEAHELLSGTPDFTNVLRAMRELRAWYAFTRQHPNDGFNYKPLLRALRDVVQIQQRR